MFGWKKKIDKKLDIIIKELENLKPSFFTLPNNTSTSISNDVIYMDEEHEEGIEEEIEEKRN